MTDATNHPPLPISLALLVTTLGACNGGTQGGNDGMADPCPRDGTVLAAFRDVERDAEGVSYSAFGAYPDRIPDFDRATGVLSLLEQVWDDGRGSCPDLPADLVSSVDASIATLQTALAARDQRASAYAANDIHALTGPLFQYFNPGIPVEVVAMDALFFRIGLDAWFSDAAGYDADLAALQADWAILAPEATSRVPTCHRVAGTASVVGDLDETLANLAAAPAASDADVGQVESDAGLLEVDILELLYDCVPDGTRPSEGVGAPCAADGDCGGGQVCDHANAGGLCSPDPATALVGQACTTTVDCGTESRNACNNEVGDGFPGGYCTLEPCDDVQVCPPGGTCVALPFETPACMQACQSDDECRAAEGYVCQLFPTTPPDGFGPSERACAFACVDDEGCTSPLTCDTASGQCTP